jgi:hypothetical protein
MFFFLIWDVFVFLFILIVIFLGTFSPTDGEGSMYYLAIMSVWHTLSVPFTIIFICEYS